uniref:Uncharacterized protein n=1 Tax=Solanum lycopersicum TaxID=4081 RepID=A0A3Q7HJV4_SOLLC
MNDLDHLHLFLGVEVKYFDGGIHLRHLSKSKYAADLLDKTEITAKTVATHFAQKNGLHEIVESLVEASLLQNDSREPSILDSHKVGYYSCCEFSKSICAKSEQWTSSRGEKDSQVHQMHSALCT